MQKNPLNPMKGLYMKTILLTNNYPDGPYSILKKVIPEGFHMEMLEKATEECLMQTVECADYILASGRVKITADVLRKAVRLKMIQRTGVGLDTIDTDALNAANIPLYVNRGVNAGSVAEHTVLLILACLRRLCAINGNTKNGIWQKQVQGITTYELRGKTVGMIGMGNIGRLTASLLKAFGADIIYYDAFRQQEAESAMQIQYAPLDMVLSESDIVSLHCPLNETTHHLINIDTLAAMKDGAVIVNTARGALIDEAALYEALQAGRIGAAGLDVHEEEPIRNTTGLLSLEQVIATPHIGGVTYDSFYRMMSEAMRNISLFDQGRTTEIAQYLVGASRRGLADS